MASGTKLRVLLATSEPVHPVSCGGIQSSAHDLLLGLSNVLGADARLLSAAGVGNFGRCRERLRNLGLHRDEYPGELHYQPGSYRAVLAENGAFLDRLDVALSTFRPDVVIAQAAGWRDVVIRCRAAGIRVVHWMHGWLGLFGDGNLPAADLLLANSVYTSEQVLLRFALQSEVFHPPIEPQRVCAIGGSGAAGAITMVNAHPAKGLELFLALARHFRDRRFIVVDCWGTAPYIEAALRREPNISHRSSTGNMCEVYAETALLIVPSMIDETFGRVVVEAHLNGIPVLASDRGALTNTLGRGGRAIPVDEPIESWATALRTLTDANQYSEWSEAARSNALRFDFETSIRRFAQLVDAVDAA